MNRLKYFAAKHDGNLDIDWITLVVDPFTRNPQTESLHWYGEFVPETEFYLSGSQVWIEHQGKVRLGGFIIQVEDDFADFSRIITDIDSGVTVWTEPWALEQLASLSITERIQSIVVSSTDSVWDAGFLGCFSSIESLFIPQACFKDLKPLREHARLKSITLGGLVDLDLAELPNIAALDSIELEGTVREIAPLAQLKRLRALDLHVEIAVRDTCQVLESMVKLERFTTQTRVDNTVLDSLSHLPTLRVVGLFNGNVSDLNAVSKMKSLEILELANNPAYFELTPLEQHRSLHTIRIRVEGAPCNLHALTTLPNLRSLDVPDTLSDDDLTSIIGSCLKLQQLEFYSDSLTTLSSLGAVSNCTSLSARCSKVTNLEPIGDLCSLVYLELASHDEAEYSFLENLEKLQDVWLLRPMKLKRLDWVANTKNLRSLCLGKSGVSDLSPLRTLPHLSVLKMTAAPVQDLSPLSNGLSLAIVEFSQCPIENLSLGGEESRGL